MTAASAAASPVERYKLRAVAALIGLVATTVLGWTWPWGLLFLSLTWSAIRLRTVELVDVVHRDQNPLLFWAIIAAWVLWSGSLVALDVLRWRWPDLYAALVLG